MDATDVAGRHCVTTADTSAASIAACLVAASPDAAPITSTFKVSRLRRALARDTSLGRVTSRRPPSLKERQLVT